MVFVMGLSTCVRGGGKSWPLLHCTGVSPTDEEPTNEEPPGLLCDPDQEGEGEGRDPPLWDKREMSMNWGT